MLQLLQPPWHRMSVSLGLPYSSSVSSEVTPPEPIEVKSAAPEQQHQYEEPPPPLPPPPLPPPPLGPSSPAQHPPDFDARVLSFAERIFAADLDAPGMEEGQAGTAAASIGAVAPAAPEEAAVAAADDYRKADQIRRRRAKKLAAAGLGGYKARGMGGARAYVHKSLGGGAGERGQAMRMLPRDTPMHCDGDALLAACRAGAT